MFVAALHEPLDHVDLVLGFCAEGLGFGAGDVGFFEGFDFGDAAEAFGVSEGCDASTGVGGGAVAFSFAVSALSGATGLAECGVFFSAAYPVVFLDELLFFFFDGFVERVELGDVCFREESHVDGFREGAAEVGIAGVG